MAIILQENETLDDVVARLQNSFEMVKDIAPVAYWYEHLNPNGRVVDIHFSDHMREMLGYKTVEEFPDELNTLMTFVHPDDVQLMYDNAIRAGRGEIDKYDVEYRIRMADGNYKWGNATGMLVKDHNGVTVGMYGSFVDIDSKKNLEAQELLHQRRLALINKMANKDGVFIVNCENNTFRVIHDRPDGITKFGSPDDYTKSFSDYINRYTAESDREKVLEMIEPAYMLEHTKDDQEIIARFKDSITGRYRYIEMKAVRLSENEVLLSLSDCHDSMVESLAHARLIDEYDALYMLDIEHNEITPVRASRVTPIGVFKGSLKYDEVALKFAETVDPKYKDDWVRFSDANYLKDYMSELDHREYVYELPGTKVRMRRLSLDVIDRKNGDARTILLSFMGIDDLRAQAILLHRQLAEQALRSKVDNETISTLSSEYLSLYHINLETRESRTYSLDAKRIPDTYKLVDHKTDVFEMVHKFANASVHPDDRQFFLDLNYDYVRELFAHRKKYTYRYRRDYGQGYLWSEMDMIKYEERDEPVKMMVLGFAERDNVIKKEIEQRQDLADALKKVETVSRAKTDFLFNMSHDIRTPMNAIKGFTVMAKKSADDKEKVKDYLHKIDVSSQQLLKLINQVLEMSRIESGKIELDEKPVNIYDRYSAMVTVLSEQAKEHGLDFNHSLKNIKHFNVFADDTRMAQITLNLAGNAIKYTMEGGRIDYTLKETHSKKDGYATYVFTVKDTGIGMSKEFLERLFEPFAREKTSTVSHIQGTGLGMSIVKSLVDMMGGKIGVESEQGKGTRFDVTIDLKIDEEQSTLNGQQSTDDSSVKDFSLKGKNILLVEDNELNREIALYLLEGMGATVCGVEDGSIAVEKMKSAKPGEFDAILMDIQMPVMDGYEATRQIRALEASLLTPNSSLLTNRNRIPIIAVSANAFAEDKQKSREAGMNDHIAKPIDIEELMGTLAKFI